ncbi:MAG: hypothetical protein K0R67_2423, partial [Paenibacillus sp.]|nr:hypothetical protein [Paenibacillus sp.]
MFADDKQKTALRAVILWSYLEKFWGETEGNSRNFRFIGGWWELAAKKQLNRVDPTSEAGLVAE